MKTKDKHEAFARIARRSAVPAALLLMLLPAAGVSRAQSNAKPSPVVVTGPTGAIAKASASPASKPPSRGTSDGIKVHGYWTIEVRNPDGKVAKHLEFENKLCTSFVDPLDGATVQGGDSTLSLLMSGTASPGLWAISLGAPENTGSSGTAVPNCAVTPYIYLSQIVTVASGPLPPGVPASLSCSFASTSGESISISGPVTNHCDRSLTVSNPPSGGPGASLSGQFGVPPGLRSLTISAVRTDLYTCTGSLGAPKPADCQNIASVIGNSCMVSANPEGAPLTVSSTTTWTGCIPGDSNVVSIVTYPVSGLPSQSPFSGVVLTGTNGVPGPFTVSQGQIVTVNWTLSFQ